MSKPTTLAATLLLIVLSASWGAASTVTMNIGFDRDPGWLEEGNRAAPFDFGYSPTSDAGGPAGEMGGTLLRAGGTARYYGFPLLRPFTLDEAFEYNFTAPSGANFYYSDADDANGVNGDNWFLGFFDRSGVGSWPPQSYVGVHLDDNNLYLSTYLGGAGSGYTALYSGLVDKTSHALRFKYDPAQGSYGTLSAQLDGSAVKTYALTQTQRTSGKTFNTFGMFPNPGGSSGTYPTYVQFDNFAFTAPQSELPKSSHDFANDLGWTGVGNRDGGFDFGYSNTANASGAAGEIGGTLSRSNGVARWYGTPLAGPISLDEPFEINWSTPYAANFFYDEVDGNSADSWLLGFFDPAAIAPWSPTAFVGLQQDDNNVLMRASLGSGHNWTTIGPGIADDSTHTFRLKYEPDEGSYGRLYAMFDGQMFGLDLLAAQRSSGALLTTFGLATVSVNGTAGLNRVFFDNLVFTNPVPEPSSIILLALAMVGLGLNSRRLRRT